MEAENFKIVVSGDVCIDLLLWETDHKCDTGLKWQHYPNVHMEEEGGEAFLLAKLVGLATGALVRSPQMLDTKSDLAAGVLRTTTELDVFPCAQQETACRQVYRVKRFLGYTGPDCILPTLLPVLDDDEDADMVILDDEDNGFNVQQEYWPLALKTPGKAPLIIYKTNNLISTGELWRHLETNHLQNTIVVINADDLRAKGVNISKSLSWEKTALDFVWQINNNPNLSFLAKCRHLIVPFGLEGAIYYHNEGVAESFLYFLTNEFEGGFIKEDQGKMYGITSCFVAGLVRSIMLKHHNQVPLRQAIGEGIREGIVAAQKYFTQGFGADLKADAFPSASIFEDSFGNLIKKEHIQDVLIRNTNSSDCQACWYIIKDKSTANLADIAYDIVKRGEESALKYMPIAQFGHLQTVDRAEIEGYRSIKNLMGEYVCAKNFVRPLSIAVFGTPGSGKSFGVTEIASSIAPKLIEKLNFNLSQFQSTADLVAAFHKVRDIALVGKVPLVFFDEFDTAFDGQRLGWLKTFLAPMQDGVFREGDTDHPIGKAIFVFAGGTSTTFTEFIGEKINGEQAHEEFLQEFQRAKGPDFVSRLRGYVNVLGPNQTDGHWDQLFVIRRAMLLRSLIVRKVPHLINDAGIAQIDDGILRAMLKIHRYKHESRSMEAILEMSMLNDAKKWEQANLPSKEQLKLHVDEEQFLRHVMHDAFFSEKIEILARELYDRQALFFEDANVLREHYSQTWHQLGNEFREYVREQVRQIPDALHAINYDIISQRDKPEVIEFTERELTILAKYEHQRWVTQKYKAGWSYGEQLEKEKKTHPLLVPWNKLQSGIQDNIMGNVKCWPGILANANFQIERLKFLCYCETRGLR